MHVFHVGQVQQHIARKLRKAVQIARHDLQLEGARAADVVARHHFRNLADGFFHGTGQVAGAAVGVQPHKGQYAQADLVAVDFGAVALDEASLFQRAHPPPAWRGRQAHALGQLGIRQTGVGLQFLQDGEVVFV